MAVAPSLIGLLVVSLVRERAPVDRAGPSTFTLSGFPRAYWNFLAVTVIFSVGNSSNSFLILRTQESGGSAAFISVLYAGFNLIAALASYPSGVLADKVGRKLTFLGSYVVFLIVYLGFFVFETLSGLAIMFLFYGLYQGTFRSIGKTLACEYTPDRLRASAIGWFSATVGLMQLAASLVAGLLWDKIGHESVFLFGVASSLMGIVALMLMLRQQPAPAVQSGKS